MSAYLRTTCKGAIDVVMDKTGNVVVKGAYDED